MVSRARRIVLMLALVALGLKLALVFTTFGTSDIRAWTYFAAGVKARGPVGVYGIDFTPMHHALYNHPPLIGYYLQFINAMASIGVPLKVTLRTVSSCADVISALLVFEIVRRRRSLRAATFAGAALAVSPVLILVSGYHGNTDPLFVMFVLLGCFLLVDRSAPIGAGIALGLAIGVKVVPIVVLPALAAYLLSRRRDLFWRALLAFTAVVAVTWSPALLTHFGPVRHHVFGYTGVNYRPWGLVRLANDLNLSHLASFLVGPGRLLALAISALVPAALVWRRPERAIEGVALSLVTFLALSPAFGVQYLAWAAAAAYLLDLSFATIYNVLGGIVLFLIYDTWNGGWPWLHVAPGIPLDGTELALLAVVWVCLLVVVVKGVRVTAAGAKPPGSDSSIGGGHPRVLTAS